MDKKIVMTGIGDVDKLSVRPGIPEAPGPGFVRIRHEAIGVNFIDIYHRIGLYPIITPAVLGVEGAGVIEAVGTDVTGLAIGDRIAYAGAPVGAYASTRVLPAARAIRLPDDISFETAAATMLRGLTAHMLLTMTFPVGRGTTVLIHAAAGGIGSILVRWAKHLGAIVIGTVGSEEKAARAKALGADHVIIGRNADIVNVVASLTNGRGVDFAIDGIGGEMLLKSINCVRPFGTVASIGQAAGPIPLLSVDSLGPRRSISLARPSIMAYSADLTVYPAAAQALFSAMQIGIVGDIGAKYSLSEAATAQASLEHGTTTGSILLLP
ncbi:MAG TPA: quinone oxidoreductase [Aestuariivirga sp.]